MTITVTASRLLTDSAAFAVFENPCKRVFAANSDFVQQNGNLGIISKTKIN